MSTTQLPVQRVRAVANSRPVPPATPPGQSATPVTARMAAALIAAQNEARKLHGPDRKRGQTYCNEAACYIARKMHAPLGPLEDAQGHPYLANRMAENLAESPAYRDLTPAQAQQLANQGRFVAGAWYNPAGHGHVVTVRPEGLPGDSPAGHSGPLLNEIGENDQVARQSMAFKPADQVHYYAPW